MTDSLLDMDEWSVHNMDAYALPYSVGTMDPPICPACQLFFYLTFPWNDTLGIESYHLEVMSVNAYQTIMLIIQSLWLHFQIWKVWLCQMKIKKGKIIVWDDIGQCFQGIGHISKYESMAMLNEKTNKKGKIIKTNGDGVHCWWWCLECCFQDLVCISKKCGKKSMSKWKIEGKYGKS